MRYTKKDLIFSVATGFITGFCVWQVFNFLKVPRYGDLSYSWLMLIVPIAWILGVNLGYFLGRRIPFFNQFGKYAAIGFTNAAVDFAVLDLLIGLTGISTGYWYPVFKGISFICAVIPSFFWNKYWAFEAGRTNKSLSEFLKFMSVMIVSILVNDGTASTIVGYVHPISGFSGPAWANISAVIGSAVALIFSFAGFKMAVFNIKNKSAEI